MKVLTLIVLLAGFSWDVFAADLEEGRTYRLDKSVYDLVRARDSRAGFIAGQHSKFVVVHNTEEATSYLVRFITIYDPIESDTTSEDGDVDVTVQKDEEYILAKTSARGVPVTKSVRPSLVGPVSGPLIVPFKYRTDDDSISGEAAIGFYAGYRTEIKIPGTNTRLPLSPFIAGGFSQISVNTNGSSDNKTGVTLAVGILVQNWANVNIGLVYGQDRVGDNSWEHEGKNWISFMVGWDI